MRSRPARAKRDTKKKQNKIQIIYRNVLIVIANFALFCSRWALLCKASILLLSYALGPIEHMFNHCQFLLQQTLAWEKTLEDEKRRWGR